MKKYIQLLLTMLKIGCVAFGGGYAIIALLESEFISKRGWVEHDEFMDVVAIAESTPGPIAINTATFIGYKTAGVWGSFFATLGTVLPSFVIILIISLLLRQFEDLKPVVYAFTGIRAGVLALILKAFFTMYKKMPKIPLSYFIAAGSFIAAALFDINVLIIIVACGLSGLLWSLFCERRHKI